MFNSILMLLKSSKFRYWLVIFLSAILAYLFGKRLIKFYGAKPSKKDKRDFRIAGVEKPEFPEEFALEIPPIKDQKDVSSCVSHSVSYLTESLLPTKGDYSLDRVSVGFTYGYRPTGYYAGEGMYPRDALKTVQQKGVVRHKNFPFNEEVPQISKMVNAQIDALLPLAAENKLPVYFQLKTKEEIKSCLMKYGPVSVMYPVHAEFMSPVDGKIDVKGLKQFQGYHQVSLYGWKGDYWLLVNSWSNSWGNNGTAYISMKYPANEFWGLSKDSTAIIPSQKKTSFLKSIFG